MLPEEYARFDLKDFINFNLILDATESAREYRETTLQLACQLLDKLPRGAVKGVYFLGNNKKYDAGGFPANASLWWQENSSRVSLLTLTVESLDASTVLLIGTGPIYDFADWRNTLGDRLIPINIGEAPLTGMAAELKSPALSELLPMLYDPVVSVDICGSDFMPYYWDNQDYSLISGEEIVLRSSRQQDLSVSLAFWGTDVRAQIRTKAGRMKNVALEPSALKIEEKWMPLTEREGEVFRKAIRDEEFTCPVCRSKHSPTTLLCSESGAILGSPVYPTLASKRGIIVLRESNSNVSFQVHPVNIFRTGETSALVALNGKAVIYGYDELSSKWRVEGEAPPYYRTKEEYLLVI